MNDLMGVAIIGAALASTGGLAIIALVIAHVQDRIGGKHRKRREKKGVRPH